MERFLKSIIMTLLFLLVFGLVVLVIALLCHFFEDKALLIIDGLCFVFVVWWCMYNKIKETDEKNH